MKTRPDCIKHCDELHTSQTFSYPGDPETFGTGAALARKMGMQRIAVNYEVLQPGDRTSWPHAHSVEEEFVFVLEGRPQAWIDGEIYDLGPGDCVSFPPGTGQAHCIINNDKEIVKLIVVGERDPAGDKIYYPKHPKRNEEMKTRGFYWEGHPEPKLGSHDGWSDRKRPR
ncbi:MAG: cupin domain-containing protein [Bacteriovoracia bacterium]